MPRSDGEPSKFLKATPKASIPNGIYPGRIADVWVYNVNEEGRYTQESTDRQKISIKFTLDDEPGVVPERTMSYFSGERSFYGKFLQGFKGFKAGSKESRDFNPKTLEGEPCLVAIVRNEPYANVENVLPSGTSRRNQTASSGVVSEDVTGKLKKVLKEARSVLLPDEVERGIESVTGDSTPLSIDTPEKAAKVIAVLQGLLDEASSDVPF